MGIFVAAACLAIWLYLLFARGGFWQVKTDNGEFVPPFVWPDITVIIPARNEADILENTLPSLLANDYAGVLRVVLVDDRSEDETSAVAARIAQRLGAAERLAVVKAQPMPAGWKGKVWAMQCGLKHVAAQGTAPRYVLFTDADIAYEKSALARLVARAEEYGLVLNSLMVRLNCKSMAERWLIPAFVYFFGMLYPFKWVSDADNKLAAAAGGCMLARYDAVQSAGGMEPIRDALIDDCAFGRLMKRQGKIRLSLTDKVHSIRPYQHVSDIRAMVARSAYDQLDYSAVKLMGALAGLLVTYIAPVLLALFSSGLPQALGLAAWLLMSISFYPMVRFYNCPLFGCVMLPLISGVYMGFTLDSAIQYWQGKGGMWKGRAQAARAQQV